MHHQLYKNKFEIDKTDNLINLKYFQIDEWVKSNNVCFQNFHVVIIIYQDFNGNIFLKHYFH